MESYKAWVEAWVEAPRPANAMAHKYQRHQELEQPCSFSLLFPS